MGTWGPGLLENDLAVDWLDSVSDLGAPDDFRIAILNALLVEVGVEEELALAAAALVAAASGAERTDLPDTVTSTLTSFHYLPTLAERHAALDHARFSSRPGSRLWARWTESGDGGLRWLANVRELVGQLDGSGPRPEPTSRSIARMTNRSTPGDLYRFHLDDTSFAWVQHMYDSDLGPVVRVLNHGSTGSRLPLLTVESTIASTLVTAEELESSDKLEFIANFTLPDGLKGQTAMRVMVLKSDRNPEGWFIRDEGGAKLTSSEYRSSNPTVNQYLLPTTEIPLELAAFLRELFGQVEN